MPCRPYSYDTVRWHGEHVANHSLIGQPIRSRALGRRAAEEGARAGQRKLSSGLERKTVVNTDRCSTEQQEIDLASPATLTTPAAADGKLLTVDVLDLVSAW